MKLENILFTLLITCAFMSCSSETEILDDMGNAGLDSMKKEAASVTLAFINNSDQTKALATNDRDIQNYVIALFNGDERIAYRSVQGNKGVTINDDALKVGMLIDIYVVANATNSDFDNMLTKEEFLNKSFTLIQNPERLVKFGKEEGYKLELPHNIVKDFLVYQLSARVDLKSLTVNFEGSDNSSAFRLTSIKLQNAQNQTFLGKEADVEETVDTQPISFSDLVVAQSQTANDIGTLYTFANKTTPVTLVITGDVMKNGQVKTANKKYTIELLDNGSTSLKRGSQYLVNVTLTSGGPKADIKVKINYTVAGWEEGASGNINFK